MEAAMSMSQHYQIDVLRHAQHPPAPAVAALHESWVDVVRLLAAFLVVFVHGLNVDQRFQALPVGSASWLATDAVLAGTRWALPIFVMISGYFLLDPRKSMELRSYYQRRVRKIAWPLLAWTALYLGITACDSWLAGRPIAPAALTGSVIKGAPYYHLWFLYMVPGLYLVAPFVKAATDHMSPQQLIAATATCFAFTILSAAIDGLYGTAGGSYITQFPRYLGYFLAGHLLGRVLPAPKLSAAITVLLVSTLVMAMLGWAAAELLSPARGFRVFGFGNPAVIVMSLAAFVLVRRLPVEAAWQRWLPRAAEASLGIYLIHPALYEALRHWSEQTAPPVLAVQGIAVFVASMLVVFAMQQTPLLRRCV
jgi:surface polysaccharide O-acyltransferase-like enzyme